MQPYIAIEFMLFSVYFGLFQAAPPGAHTAANTSWSPQTISFSREQSSFSQKNLFV